MYWYLFYGYSKDKCNVESIKFLWEPIVMDYQQFKGYWVCKVSVFCVS